MLVSGDLCDTCLYHKVCMFEKDYDKFTTDLCLCRNFDPVPANCEVVVHCRYALYDKNQLLQEDRSYDEHSKKHYKKDSDSKK